MGTKPKRVLLDTNILLDFFDKERVGHTDAVALLWCAAEEPAACETYASISSFKDAYYILTRLYRSEPIARGNIEFLLRGIVEPLDLCAAYGNPALSSGEPDFEDALIRITAESEGMDAIITRDATAYSGAGIAHMDAATFLQQLGFQYELVTY